RKKKSHYQKQATGWKLSKYGFLFHSLTQPTRSWGFSFSISNRKPLWFPLHLLLSMILGAIEVHKPLSSSTVSFSMISPPPIPLERRAHSHQSLHLKIFINTSVSEDTSVFYYIFEHTG
uniref:Uncharacterized protein n=1 Tax=Marmota marmota marmota TaxID=9994 RepID=A0A8C5ZYS6_MARMA